jgi:hypothetical protein
MFTARSWPQLLAGYEQATDAVASHAASWEIYTITEHATLAREPSAFRFPQAMRTITNTYDGH